MHEVYTKVMAGTSADGMRAVLSEPWLNREHFLRGFPDIRGRTRRPLADGVLLTLRESSVALQIFTTATCGLR